MHRIGVISDTHGLLREEAVKILRSCETILHGGDIGRQEILDELNKIAPTYAVRGNTDKEWAKGMPETLSLELFGVKFLIVHNKKMIPEDIKGIDVIIYGHSHKYEKWNSGKVLFLNPGSCGPRRFALPITLAVLEVKENGSYKVQKAELGSYGILGIKPEFSEISGKRTPGDMKQTIKRVMRDTDRKIAVEEIAKRNGIGRELAEQICRLYLTHPGVDADGIMSKMGL